MTIARRRAVRIATCAALGLLVASSARAGAMRDCVEQGGVYLEDGTCERGDDEAAARCRRRGGRWLSSGRCELPAVDPEERCRESGGIGMHDGRCYRLRTRDDPPPRD